MAVDEAQFLALVRAREWNETIDKFRETGNAALKRKLPAFIFQATFDETTSKAGTVGRWRKQAATRLTGLVVMDIDHVDNPREVQDSWFRIHGDMKELGILLIYITPSGKGLKVVFKARMEWGNLIDNQHAMAKLLGVEVDESCKDASRMSFICKESDILFLDKELFTYEDKSYGEKFDGYYRKGRPTPPVDTFATRKGGEAGAEVKSPSEGEQGGGLTYHNIPYAAIVEAWVRDEKVEAGDRHRTSLILADHLRYITDNDPALIEAILRATPFVDEIVRERNEDVAATVRSAQDYKLYKNIPQRMQQALAKVGVTTPAQPTPLPSREGSGVGLPLAAWGSYGFADPQDTKEMDLTLSYTTGGLTIGVTDYWFNTGLDPQNRYFKYDAHATNHVFEAAAGYDFGPLALQWYTVFAGNDGTNNDGKRAYSSYLEANVPFRLASVDWTATAGLVPFATNLYGTTGFAVTNLSLKATKDIRITDSFRIPIFGQIVANPCSQKAYLVLGITLHS